MCSIDPETTADSRQSPLYRIRSLSVVSSMVLLVFKP